MFWRIILDTCSNDLFFTILKWMVTLNPNNKSSYCYNEVEYDTFSFVVSAQYSAVYSIESQSVCFCFLWFASIELIKLVINLQTWTSIPSIILVKIQIQNYLQNTSLIHVYFKQHIWFFFFFFAKLTIAFPSFFRIRLVTGFQDTRTNL